MMMMNTTDELAASVLAELHRRLNRAPAVEQVDFVDCETTDDIMAYVYHSGGDCEPILLEHPPEFDIDLLAAALIRGVAPAVVH